MQERNVQRTPTNKKTWQKKKVCAYVRVSTKHDLQMNSLENQTQYYTQYILKNPSYEFCGIYSDSGVSGINENRPGLNEMLEKAYQGEINLIITKSISRFARNTVFLLKTIRKLKAAGVAIYFEKENINSFSVDGELMLTVLASFAEEERKSVCENIKWSVRSKYKQGIFQMDTNRLLGYDKDENGMLVINQEQAEIVRLIFKEYLVEKSAQKVAEKLNELLMSCSNSFADTSDVHWAQSEINYLIDKGIISGDDSGIRPDDNILRAEFARVINKLFGFQEETGSGFPDVSEDKWYFHDMNVAKQAEYLKGDASGNANPEAYLNRYEACVVVARILNSNTSDGGDYFKDSRMIPSWAKVYVNSLYKMGMIAGYEDGEFKGEKNMTRAELFSILVRTEKLYKKPAETVSNIDPLSIVSTANVNSPKREGGGGGNHTGSSNNPGIPSNLFLNLDDYSLKWSKDSRAAGFEVRLERITNEVNSVLNIDTVSTSLSLAESMTDLVGDDEQNSVECFSVSVKAKGKAGSEDSAYSHPVEFSALARPSVTYEHFDGETVLIKVKGDKNTLTYSLDAYLGDAYIGTYQATGSGTDAEFNLSGNNFNLGSTYDFVITACRKGEKLPISSVKHQYFHIFKIPDPLLSLANWTEDEMGESYTISWEKAEYEFATAYRTEVYDGDLLAYSEENPISENSFKLTDTKVSLGKNYTVKVKVKSNSGDADSGYASISVNTLYAGGTGTDLSPYIIKNARQFSNIELNLSAVFAVANDIGTVNRIVTGSFSGKLMGFNEDGGELEMRTIDIKIAGISQGTGVFQNLGSGARIEYIRLTGEVTSNYGRVGGFAGENAGGGTITIENCINEANITGTSEVGGFIGRAYGSSVKLKLHKVTNVGTIEAKTGSGAGGFAGIAGAGSEISKSANKGNVSAANSYRAGGIAGESNGSTIDECYNAGDILASAHVGGLIGRANGGTTYVKNSFNRGSVTSTTVNVNDSSAAGIIGYSTVARTIENCYNAGDISAVVKASPIIIYPGIGYDGSMKNNYYLSESLEDDGINETTPLNGEDMKDLLNFINFDTENIWTLGSSEYKYPILKGVE